LEYKITE